MFLSKEHISYKGHILGGPTCSFCFWLGDVLVSSLGPAWLPSCKRAVLEWNVDWSARNVGVPFEVIEPSLSTCCRPQLSCGKLLCEDCVLHWMFWVCLPMHAYQVGCPRALFNSACDRCSGLHLIFEWRTRAILNEWCARAIYLEWRARAIILNGALAIPSEWRPRAILNDGQNCYLGSPVPCAHVPYNWQGVIWAQTRTFPVDFHDSRDQCLS